MDVYPDMDIHFPENRESELLQEMRSRESALWASQEHNTVDRPVEDGEYFFHRDSDGIIVACALCIIRTAPGHLRVTNIVPDKMGDHISVDQYAQMLHEFDSQIAAPSAEAVEGMTVVETSRQNLSDYFSQRSIELLKAFCLGSNAGDLGNHPSDQRKWRAFLLHVFYNEEERVSGDVFGRLLSSENWWPDSNIRRLANQYNFAMALLEQNDE
jgi:hypothetical protein